MKRDLCRKKDRHRRAFPPGRLQHRDAALLRAGSACCRRHVVKKGGRFRDTIATMARPNSSTPLVRLALRPTRSGNSAPRRISTSSRQRRTSADPSSIDERDPFKAERLSDQTGSRRFGSHDRLREPQCASAGGGSFIIRSISGPPVFRKRHTRSATKPRNAMLSQVV
jgi:hypothetical protein